MPSSSSSINALIAAIPFAQDGDIITREYHNSVRNALAALAALAEGGPIAGPASLTFAPAFLPNDGGPNWHLVGGIATRPFDAAGVRLGSAHSWMPLQLPDNVRLQSLTVFGRRSGTISSFTVNLFRSNIIEEGTLPVIELQLKEADDPFERTATPSSASNATVVDNRLYKYYLVARLRGANTPDDVAEIKAIRIAYQPA